MLDIEVMKQFLRENLEVVVEYENQYGPDFNQTVGLRFRGERDCFTETTIYVPTDD